MLIFIIQLILFIQAKEFEKTEGQFHKSKRGDDWKKVSLRKFCSVLQQIVPILQFKKYVKARLNKIMAFARLRDMGALWHVSKVEVLVDL